MLRHTLNHLGAATPRQDLPPVWIDNGAACAADIPWLTGHGSFLAATTVACQMSRERSADVDTAAGLEALRPS